MRIFRHRRGHVEPTWRAIEEALRPLVRDAAVAQDVASAFYDVAWVPIDNRARTYEDACQEREDGVPVFAMSWRNAGGMVADLRGRDETYMDWCFDANSGYVSPRILALMASLGLRPVT